MKATFFEEPVDQYSCVERAWRSHINDRDGQAIFYRSRPGEWQGCPGRWSIKYVLAGDCAFEIDGQWCDVFGGFAFVIPAHCPYRSQVRSGKTLSLFGRELAGAPSEPQLAIFGVFSLDPRELALLITRLAALRGQDSPVAGIGPEQGVSVALDEPLPLPCSWILLHQRLQQWLRKGEGRERAARRLLQARHFLTAEFRSQNACSRAAEVANMTRSHFSRQFSALFGQCPRQYLVAYRSMVAQSLLRSGSRSVESVAAQLGYRHSSSLAHLFQRKKLSNPRRHRASHSVAGHPRGDSRSTG